MLANKILIKSTLPFGLSVKKSLIYACASFEKLRLNGIYQYFPSTWSSALLTFFCLLFWTSNPSQATSQAYRVTINNVSGETHALLTAISDCITLQDTPPSTPGLLQKRMDNDEHAFIQALKSRGYFQAQIKSHLNIKTTPWAVSFTIDLGPQFTFAEPVLVIDPPNETLQSLLQTSCEPIKKGQAYDSRLIQDVENDLLRALQENGYPSPTLGQRKIVADHATGQVTVHLAVQPESKAVFGSTTITGLKTVSENLVMQKLAWTQGADFDIRKVDTTRAELIQTGLFRSVYIKTELSDDASPVTMLVDLLESPHRTLRYSLWYYSDQGPGLGTSWTHRNLLGAGQEYQAAVQLAEKNQELSTSLILPDFGHPDQSLNLLAKYEYEDTDSYESSNVYLSGIVRRNFSRLSLGAGLAYRLSSIKKESTRQFNLISTPLIAEWSNVEQPLDPTHGLTVAGRLEPFIDMEGGRSSFVSWNLTGRHYWPLRTDKSLILATRGRYSLLAGASRHSVPEDLLLYAGGGGSVRGYAYQYAGDLDDDDKPLGGISAIDFSAELRWRINKDFGAVFFCDAGTALQDHNLDDMDKLFWGVGTGLRYFTPIGPIRFDVAIPLDQRGTIDSPFQVYVSLGQAF